MSQLEREIAEIPERLTAVAPVNRVALAEASRVLDQHAGEEHSAAATKSVVCSLLAVDLLAEALSGHVDRLEARGIAVARVVAKAMASPPDLTVLETIESAFIGPNRQWPGFRSCRCSPTRWSGTPCIYPAINSAPTC